MSETPTRYGIVIDDHDMNDEDFRRALVFIDSNKSIIDWHSPFRGFIIVISRENLVENENSITDYFDNIRYSIFELNVGENRGSFAMQTWQWLEESNSFDVYLDGPDAQKN